MRPLKPDDVLVLQLSGGKDSLACLFLLESIWDQIYVLWMNTGQAFPETLELMQRLRTKLPKFIEVRSDVGLSHAQNGFPVDLLPVRHHPGVQKNIGLSLPRLQTFVECCYGNIMAPLHEATLALKPTVIIRGQKQADALKGPFSSGDKVGDFEFWYPIEGWTDDQVMRYLLSKEELPLHYQYFNSSMDCWSCTAFLRDNLGKRDYMKKFHPEWHAEVTGRFEAIVKMTKPDEDLLEKAYGRR